MREEQRRSFDSRQSLRPRNKVTAVNTGRETQRARQNRGSSTRTRDPFLARNRAPTARHGRGGGSGGGEGEIGRRPIPGRRGRARRAWRAAGRGPSAPCGGGRSPGTSAMAISSRPSPKPSSPQARNRGLRSASGTRKAGGEGGRRARRGSARLGFRRRCCSRALEFWGPKMEVGERIVSRRRRAPAGGGTSL